MSKSNPDEGKDPARKKLEDDIRALMQEHSAMQKADLQRDIANATSKALLTALQEERRTLVASNHETIVKQTVDQIRPLLQERERKEIEQQAALVGMGAALAVFLGVVGVWAGVAYKVDQGTMNITEVVEFAEQDERDDLEMLKVVVRGQVDARDLDGSVASEPEWHHQSHEHVHPPEFVDIYCRGPAATPCTWESVRDIPCAPAPSHDYRTRLMSCEASTICCGAFQDGHLIAVPWSVPTPPVDPAPAKR